MDGCVVNQLQASFSVVIDKGDNQSWRYGSWLCIMPDFGPPHVYPEYFVTRNDVIMILDNVKDEFNWMNNDFIQLNVYYINSDLNRCMWNALLMVDTKTTISLKFDAKEKTVTDAETINYTY